MDVSSLLNGLFKLLERDKVLLLDFPFILCKLPGLYIEVVVIAFASLLQPNSLASEEVYLLGDSTLTVFLQKLSGHELHLVVHYVVEDVDQRVLRQFAFVHAVD